MPTYNYLCHRCDHKFEVIQSMKDKPLEYCPQCDAKTIRRVIGAAPLHLTKGNGFEGGSRP